jgi:hypothetical protein
MIARAPKDVQPELLQQHQSPGLKTLLKYAYDPNIKWHLPEGDLPAGMFKPWKYGDAELVLQGESRKLYIFCSGAEKPSALLPMESDTREKKMWKRQQLEKKFVELLESIDPSDIDLVIAAKDKKLHVDIDSETVLRAFPGLY